MNLDSLSRQQLQQLCKDNNIKANLKTDALITLLQSHLAAGNQLRSSGDQTRPTTAPPSHRPLSLPPTAQAQEGAVTSHPRTRKASRTTRAASTSTRPSVPPVLPPEEVTIESEKENKKDPPRRKARDTQKRLGVGKPRAAGGNGPRTVTRIVPSRSASTRTRSRVDIVQGNGQMEVVVEEESNEEPSVSQSVPPSSTQSSSHRNSGSESGPSPEPTVALNRRISNIESQINQLITSRDSLLSKLSAQEKTFTSIQDDITSERTRTLDEVSKNVEARIAQHQAESSGQEFRTQAQLTETQKLLNNERERVAKLESQMESLTQRLMLLEDRLSASSDGASNLASGSEGAGITPSIIYSNPSAVLSGPSASNVTRKRVASDDLERGVRSSKRPRQEPYSPATLLQNAFAQIHATSSDTAALPLPPPAAELAPRTPPLTRNARRQLQFPPASPRGGGPSSNLRHLPPTARSPTTDSPRKGAKAKGKAKETLPLASPSKLKLNSKSGASSSVPASANSTATGRPSSDYLLGLTEASADGPAFPVYEPPNRFNRGLGVGLGRPSSAGVIPSEDTSTHSMDHPSGLLPPFPHNTYAARRASNNSADSDSLLVGGDLDMHEPSTPLIAGDGWGMSSDDAPPPSPDKRTLYGTEVVYGPEQFPGDIRDPAGSGAGNASEVEEWM